MLRMNSVRKKRTDKTVVKEHIVLAAAKAFAQKGVKTVRMDDIATGLSISKRTLYELFHDKEDLLLDVMKLHREEMQEYMTQVASKAENVLEVLLKFFQRSAQDFQNTNRKFFEDIEKYPKVMRYILYALWYVSRWICCCIRKYASPIRLVKFMKQLYLCICVAFPLKRG